MSADWRARVLTEVDAAQGEMEQRLAQLVRVPSVGGTAAENEIQALLAGILASTGVQTDHWRVPLQELLRAPGFPGAEVARSEAWGLVGCLPGLGDGPSLMVNGHIDVVPPGPASAWRTGDPYSGRVLDGSLHGRGACDMKGGVVAGLWAMTALRRAEAPLRGDVLLATVQGEEDGGLGTYALLQRGWRADACVITEPTRLDVVPANAGALTFRITIRGLAAHASRRTEGVSAVEKLWSVWRAVQAVERRRNAEVDPLFARHLIAYPINIGTIAGGVWPSSVPDVVVVQGRLGVALGEPVEEARSALADALAAACERDLWLREHPVELEWWGGQFASGRLPTDHPLLERVRAAHSSVTGGPRPDVWGAPYGSDLRLLAAAGVPTVQYGPGDVDLAHTTDESVPLDEVRTAARALAVLALDHCGV